MLRLILASLLAGLVAVPAATAATPNQILRDCEDDGVLQGNYSANELREARRRIPTDLDQYTDCRDVLSRAAARGLTGAPGPGGGPGGTAGPGAAAGQPLTPTSDKDLQAMTGAILRGKDPVKIDGTTIVPGAVGLSGDAVRNDLPGSLVAVLILLALAAAALTVPAARAVVRERLTGSISALRRRVLHGRHL